MLASASVPPHMFPTIPFTPWTSTFSSASSEFRGSSSEFRVPIRSEKYEAVPNNCCPLGLHSTGHWSDVQSPANSSVRTPLRISIQAGSLRVAPLGPRPPLKHKKRIDHAPASAPFPLQRSQGRWSSSDPGRPLNPLMLSCLTVRGVVSRLSVSPLFRRAAEVTMESNFFSNTIYI